MSVITEVLDRLPSPDGGFRRRFTSGILFFLILTVGIYWFPGFPAFATTLSEALSSAGLKWSELQTTGSLIILFSVVFVVGNLIEVFSYVFLNQLFFFAGGILAYRGVSASYQRISGADEEAISLSVRERETYEKLPPYVREGLANPYKRQFEVAFRFLIHKAPDSEKAWLTRLDSRNQNLFSVLSTIFMATFLIILLSAPEILNGNSNPLTKSSKAVTSPQQQCLIDTLGDAERDAIVSHASALEIQGLILKGNPVGIEKFQQAIATYSPSNADERGNLARVHRGVGICLAPTDEQTTVEVGFFDIAVRVITFVGIVCGLLIVLSLIYALMLRFSITSALEMLWLRTGIVGGNEESDGSIDRGSSATDSTSKADFAST